MSSKSAMDMPGWLDVLGGLMDRTSGFWRTLGNIESNAHRDQLDGIALDRPIFLAGLARSGSTIVLELLAEHADTATHRYRDFPPVFIPVFWNRAFAHIYGKEAPAVERAHKDRILVTPDSPEAMEEVLWMAFFPHCHDPGQSHVLGRTASNPAFEKFYIDHLKKILMIRGGRRYLSKGNYNATRLAYLAQLLPDSRMVVPVRDPAAHVASLLKQHRLFCKEEQRDPRILKHMRRVGHFEFGLDRRVVHCGDDRIAKSIDELWLKGEDARGYARLWASIYSLILDQLDNDSDLKQRVMLLRYEDLCEHPKTTLAAVFDHVALPITPQQLETAAGRVSYPTYYDPGLTAAEMSAIKEETSATAARLGY